MTVVTVVWRVEALALPRLARACTRCSCDALEPTGRFRVNAQKRRLDVWLLYRCPGCGAPARERVRRRGSPAQLGAALEAFTRDDPATVRACAFALPVAGTVPWRLHRRPLPAGGWLRALIVQPEPCGLRWDRLLAHALGSRSAARRAFRRGALRLPGVGSLARDVRDGEAVELRLNGLRPRADVVEDEPEKPA